MTLHVQVAALLERAARSPLPAYHTVPAFVARRIYRDTRAALAPQPPAIAEARLVVLGGKVAVRAYRPVLAETLPALVFFHGGGWTIGDLDTHDVVCRQLASGARCAVFSVDYRLAPEHPFPAAVDDCFFADRIRPEERRLFKSRSKAYCRRRRQRRRQSRRGGCADGARRGRAAAVRPAPDLPGDRPALRLSVARAQRRGLSADPGRDPVFPRGIPAESCGLHRLAGFAAACREPRRPAAGIRPHCGLRPAWSTKAAPMPSSWQRRAYKSPTRSTPTWCTASYSSAACWTLQMRPWPSAAST